MKAMTCKHLRDAVASGDSVHEDALKGMGWYNQVKKDFAAL